MYPLQPNEKIAQVLEYIEKHLDEPMTCKELAERFHYAPNYFHRLFAQATGRNLGEFVRDRRLATARLALRHTEQPIMDILLGCGFDSAPAFHRTFKREFGLSPSAYRKMRGLNPMEEMLRTIVALRTSGEYTQAMAEIERLLETKPNFGVLYAHRGFVHYQLGNAKKALADYNHAINEYGCCDLWVLAEKSAVLYRLERYAEAVEIYANAAAIPGGWDGWGSMHLAKVANIAALKGLDRAAILPDQHMEWIPSGVYVLCGRDFQIRHDSHGTYEDWLRVALQPLKDLCPQAKEPCVWVNGEWNWDSDFPSDSCVLFLDRAVVWRRNGEPMEECAAIITEKVRELYT